MTPETLSTRVGIVGGGPSGLLLSHLLSTAGIDSIGVAIRDREAVRTSPGSALLEPDNVSVLVESGASDRILTAGRRAEGIGLRFEEVSHRVDFTDLIGAAVWLYPRSEVFADLAAARDRDGGRAFYSASELHVLDQATDTPKISFVGADGGRRRVHCDIVVGADGAQGTSRWSIPPSMRIDNFVEYPVAWFGIRCQAPPTADEPLYCASDRGFALVSPAERGIQRMYFQCSPDEDVYDWSDEMIWDELQRRLDGPDGLRLHRGPIIDKSVQRFRSYVCEPLRHGNLFLAGDAGHTLPPIAAKGLNLALADATVLFEGIDSFYANGSRDLLDSYSERSLRRVWKALSFSGWLTDLLHTRPDAGRFDRKRQLGELAGVVGSRYGSAYLAEAFTGWPAR